MVPHAHMLFGQSGSAVWQGAVLEGQALRLLLQTPKHSVHVLLCFLETGSCSVGYAGLELTMWPRLASECWSNKCEPSHEALLQHLAYLSAVDTSLRKEKTADQFS